MSRQSENVKKWRKSTKTRIVQSMGGKCICCGYNNCTGALALHHIDPSKKDFTLGSVRANAKSWKLIVEELKKCILICHNCHSEIHEGVRKLPDIYPVFDESFSDYYNLTHLPEQDICPVCKKYKPVHQITCSRSCAAKKSNVVKWESMDLEHELKNKSILSLAEELGCSDGAIHKRLKKLGLK